MKRIFSPLAIVVTLLVLAGCAGNKAAVDVSERDYLKMDASERQAHERQLSSEKAVLEQWRISRLQAFQPVTFGTKATGYTVQCHWMPGEYNQIAIYNGHNAPGLSRATHQAMMVQMADNNCDVLYRPVRDNSGEIVTVSPVTILNDAAAQEDMLRVMGRTIAPAILNGTGAVALREAFGNDCGNGGCAPTFITSAVAQQSATAESEADVDVNSGSCVSGQCKSGPPED